MKSSGSRGGAKVGRDLDGGSLVIGTKLGPFDGFEGVHCAKSEMLGRNFKFSLRDLQNRDLRFADG